MKQNTFWLIVALVVIFVVIGGFTLAAPNRTPGIIVMVSGSIAAVLIYLRLVKT